MARTTGHVITVQYPDSVTRMFRGINLALCLVGAADDCTGAAGRWVCVENLNRPSFVPLNICSSGHFTLPAVH